MTDVRALFAVGVNAVVAAVSDARVAAVWDEPSALEEQTIGSLAGHLARGGVWVVDEYLDIEVITTTPDYISAGDYYAQLMSVLTSTDGGQQVRDRGAAIAAAGPAEVARELTTRAASTIARVRAAPADAFIAVIGGKVLGLDDYLVTRIVEQTVHLDDLARSIGADDAWPLPTETYDLVNNVAVEVSRRHLGAAATLRGLYRRGFAEIFPVF